jgi:hypothetical protein
MAEWWKALSLQRVCFERFHDLASHRGAFSISFETIQHNLKKNDMKKHSNLNMLYKPSDQKSWSMQHRNCPLKHISRENNYTTYDLGHYS